MFRFKRRDQIETANNIEAALKEAKIAFTRKDYKAGLLHRAAKFFGMRTDDTQSIIFEIKQGHATAGIVCVEGGGQLAYGETTVRVYPAEKKSSPPIHETHGERYSGLAFATTRTGFNNSRNHQSVSRYNNVGGFVGSLKEALQLRVG